jgi:hypothetical protein
MANGTVSLKWWLLVFVVLWLAGTDPRGLLAQSGDCFMTFKVCFDRASRMRYWEDRLLSSLDCELNFVDCARRKIIGR